MTEVLHGNNYKKKRSSSSIIPNMTKNDKIFSLYTTLRSFFLESISWNITGILFLLFETWVIEHLPFMQEHSLFSFFCSGSFIKFNLILFFNLKNTSERNSSHRACFTPSHTEDENHSARLMHVLLTVFLFFCLRATIQSICLHVIKYRVHVCISIFQVFGWVP